MSIFSDSTSIFSGCDLLDVQALCNIAIDPLDSPRALATIRGKVTARTDADPCKEGKCPSKNIGAERSWVQIPAPVFSGSGTFGIGLS